MAGTEAGAPDLQRALTLMEARRSRVESELREVDQVLGVLRRAAAAMACQAPSSPASVAASPREEASDVYPAPDDGLVLMETAVPFPGKTVTAPPEGGQAQTERALALLGPARDDNSWPSVLDEHRRRSGAAEVPPSEEGLAKLRASVAGIAAVAARAPAGPGGRRRLSSRGLVPGDPLLPSLRNVLRAADRQLTSAEIAAAVLDMRKVELPRLQLVALVNRVSALLGQEAKKKRVRREREEGTRTCRWVAAPQEPAPEADAQAQAGAGSAQPSGSTG